MLRASWARMSLNFPSREDWRGSFSFVFAGQYTGWMLTRRHTVDTGRIMRGRPHTP